MAVSSINVYDFDHTIYNGDCTVDFYLFCIKRNPLLLRYLPYQVWHFLLFKLKLERRTVFKGNFFVFLHGIREINSSIDAFWESHYRKIKKWYRETDHANDVIISASPIFLLEPAFKKLKAHTLIATNVDPVTGLIIGENCYGDEKVARLKQVLHGTLVGQAYTDSLSDLPILTLASEAFIVKGDKILTLKDYRETARHRRRLPR